MTTQHAKPTLDPTRTYSAAEILDLLSRAKISGSKKSVMSVADVKLRYQKIGANISPHLLSDGSNFSEWSEALSIEVASLFEHSQYFESANIDASAERASLTATILQFSIHPDLVPLVRGKVGREAFKILKERFDKTSWTYVMTRWISLSSINVLQEPDKAYNSVFTTLKDIEKRLGAISIDVLAAFILHQNSQHCFHKISNALDTRLAVNPHLCFSSKDVLELLGQYKTDENQQQNAVLAISASTGRRPPATVRARTSTLSQEYSVMNRPNGWAQQWLTPTNPCLYCFEWGHWLADCLEKHANRPPRPDPRLTNPGAQLRRLSHCHRALATSPAGPQVASVQSQPYTDGAALADLGATTSVSNNVCLFTNLKPISVRLMVASTDTFEVKSYGDLHLPTPQGTLKISDALLCPQIQGTIISTGKFGKADCRVEFDGSTYTFVQNDTRFPTREVNNRCFLFFHEPPAAVVSSLNNKFS